MATPVSPIQPKKPGLTINHQDGRTEHVKGTAPRGHTLYRDDPNKPKPQTDKPKAEKSASKK